MHLNTHWVWHFRCLDQTIALRITPKTLDQVTITDIDTATSQNVIINCSPNTLQYDNGYDRHQLYYDRLDKTLTLYLEQGPVEVCHLERQQQQDQNLHAAQLTAPMPGTIVAILKQLGEEVAPGDALIVLEAMKMEHTIRAPNAGTVQEIFYPVGTQVQEGVTLAALEPL